MLDDAKKFEHHKYLYIPNFIDKDDCAQLTTELKNLITQGQTTQDEQCPLSEAIHGAPIFDKLLEELLPHFEKHCGKKLYPTYSYARLYKPGEELTIHRDRPACEISATLTLGFSGTKWPIYMGHNEDKTEASEIIMEIGDAVLYRGMDVYHWREKFEGEWQAQVFLHYVDADGPHAEWKYDKREQLGQIKLSSNHDQEIEHLATIAEFENHLPDVFCNSMIETYSTEQYEKVEPKVGPGIGNVDKSIRDTERVFLPVNKGIGAILTATALNANHYWWKYDVTHSHQTEFLIYKPGGHYKAHVDTFHAHGNKTRKLTALAFLNDDYEGGKFYLNADGNIYYPPQTKGAVIVFPSYMVHGVEPVTKGIRYSVVTWLEGPYFK